MKNIIQGINKYKIEIFLWGIITLYIAYFSYFTVLRYHTLYASYFDLGIMHQTVYNTYMAIKTGDWSRFLELTNPYGAEQIKRMAIHNDILLALAVPFYFIHPGVETLLIIQVVVIALGAWAVFKIGKIFFNNNFLSFIFSFLYLLYPPLQRANIFDFHPVTLATTFLLFMFYFWLIKKYWWSFLFFVLSILSKEQVAATTVMFGMYSLLSHSGKSRSDRDASRIDSGRARMTFSLAIILLSIVWFILSIFFITPYFRGGAHFALEYYGDFNLFHIDTFRYFFFLLGPLGFLSLLSPIQLFISLPEFVINLLSHNWNMRNIIFHYTSVITPFVFISGICGMKRLSDWLLKLLGMTKKRIIIVNLFFLSFFTLLFAYFKGPLPFSREAEMHPFKYPQGEYKDVALWSKTLRDENLKISSTGQLAPFFTSRRFFYIFSDRYQLSDYIVIRPNEIYNYPEKDELVPVYERLKKNKSYQLIYQKSNFEVYKKVTL